MYDHEISNLIPEIKVPLGILFAKAGVNYDFGSRFFQLF